MKKKVISTGDGASIIIHAHFALTAAPHPCLRNLPYGAVILNKMKKTTRARLNTVNTEILYTLFIIKDSLDLIGQYRLIINEFCILLICAPLIWLLK